MKFTRRDVIRTTAGVAAGALGSRFLGSPAFAQEGLKYQPEAGATLRLLRWSPFVQGDEDQWLENTKRFTEATGVQVRPAGARNAAYGVLVAPVPDAGAGLLGEAPPVDAAGACPCCRVWTTAVAPKSNAMATPTSVVKLRTISSVSGGSGPALR